VDGDMTHTEESLMKIARLCCGEPITYTEKAAWSDLLLAIREVLAERDALAMQVKLKPAPMADCPVYCKTAVDLQAERERAALNSISAFAQADENFARAEKAEAECERLRDALAELSVAELLDDDHPRLIAARQKALAAMKEQP
jgi:hypothetical protein